MKTVAIVGYGKVGSSYHKVFPEAIVYDPYKELYGDNPDDIQVTNLSESQLNEVGKDKVNKCDVAIVAVFTPYKEDGTLDTSIVEEVVGWIECPLIIIKSALHPGTVDRLVKETGKRIAVSTEFVGEGNYYVPPHKYPDQNDPRKHQMLIVGGELEVASEAAEVIWRRMSPDIKIHLVTALEAEIVKLVENSWPAIKVTFINSLMSLADKSGSNFLRIHQAWQSDPRVESMHMRGVHFDRGWASKCWSKDVPALASYSKEVGANDMSELLEAVLKINEFQYRLTHDKSPYEL